MKTVITQKIESIPSPVANGNTLENQAAIAVLEVKGELVLKSSQHANGLTHNKNKLPQQTKSLQVFRFRRVKRQHIKKLWIGFGLTLSAGSLLLLPLVNTSITNRSSQISAPASSTPSALSAAANLSQNLSYSAQVDTDFIYPLVTPAPLTSPFGWRRHPLSGQKKLHAGVDFEAPYGAPIVAAITGKVVVADWHGGHGKAVVIERQGKFQTLYAHMSKIMVQKGATVQQGEVIGYVGSTGRSTGAHLHFETLLPGKDKDSWVAVDPAPGIRYALNSRQQSTQVSSINQVDHIN